MKILLILAHSKAQRNFFFKMASKLLQPSLTLLQLAAITPKKHVVELIDCRFQNVDFNCDCDIVGISSYTYSAEDAYKIADYFRMKGKTVILGGYHPSSMPEEAKQHADSVVIGEAEISWPKLLEDFEGGNLKPFYQSELVDPRYIPVPARNLQKNMSFVSRVQATRGCPNRCEFCAVKKVEGYAYRKRPVEHVINEIKSLPTSSFSFDDSSLTIDLDYTKELFGGMVGLKKSFSCYGNINILNENDDLIELSKKAGCSTWCVGFESISQDSLIGVRKSNKIENYANAIKKIRKNGIKVKGLFMFGFDEDTPDIFNRTIKAIKEWKIDFVYFSILTPLPGTPLYDKLDKEGRILTKDWSKYTCGYVVFQPKKMSNEELFNKTWEVAKDFYSIPNIAKRSLNDNLNLQQFGNRLMYNLVDKIYFKKNKSF